VPVPVLRRATARDVPAVVALRARIEAGRRGDGLGATMVRYAVDEARRRGAALVQLTSDRSRTDAHRFYERLGFLRTHDGFSLPLI
jgi:GNAT superfamily N-acetyltransferase